MIVLHIRKFHKDPIKTKWLNELFRHLRASISEVFCQSWPNFEQVRDFRLPSYLKVWQQSYHDALSSGQHFPIRHVSLWVMFKHSRALNSKANNPIWPEFELVRDVMPVLVICQFHKDPIKTKQPKLRTGSNLFFFFSFFLFFFTQGQVTPKWKVRSG